ncbi:MAG TPA: hypothetical protein VMW54_10510 [Terriglobia bacterium]|nr:hypothetical protein [Terriglobia bacterium]
MKHSDEMMALRAFCMGAPQGSIRNVGKSLLANYRWQNVFHEAMWKALLSSPSENPQILRQLLPAKLTRLGFPDVDWEEFFAPHQMSRDDAINLMRRMTATKV